MHSTVAGLCIGYLRCWCVIPGYANQDVDILVVDLGIRLPDGLLDEVVKGVVAPPFSGVRTPDAVPHFNDSHWKCEEQLTGEIGNAKKDAADPATLGIALVLTA